MASVIDPPVRNFSVASTRFSRKMSTTRDKTAEDLSVASVSISETMSAPEDQVALDYSKERQRVRLAQKFLPAKTVQDLCTSLLCSKCEKPFSQTILMTPMGKSICGECKLKPKKKEASQEQGVH